MIAKENNSVSVPPHPGGQTQTSWWRHRGGQTHTDGQTHTGGQTPTAEWT